MDILTDRVVSRLICIALTERSYSLRRADAGIRNNALTLTLRRGCGSLDAASLI